MNNKKFSYRKIEETDYNSSKKLEFNEKYKISENKYLDQLNDSNSQVEKISNLAIKISVGSIKNKFKEDFNTIYIPKIGKSNVCTSIEDLRLKEQNYIKVNINPNNSYADFIASFLNSELGLKIREECKKGFIPSLNKSIVGDMRVLVPCLNQQKMLLKLLSKINRKKNDLYNISNSLEEIKMELISKPSSFIEVTKKYEKISKNISSNEKIHQKSFIEWIDTIPFPLAIILREYLSLKDGEGHKYRLLLKFFEASVAFLSTIYFGAFRENENHFKLIKKKLKEDKMIKFNHLTFGVWVQTYSIFSKYTRNLLQTDSDSCVNIFCDDNLSLPSTISQKRLVKIFQDANTIRNKDDAHGSYIDQESAEALDNNLYSMVESFREHIGEIWNKNELIKVEKSEAYSENKYIHHVSSLMGSHTSFIKKTKQLEYNLYRGNLYLINSNNSKPIKLERFLKIEAPPQKIKNACYFYNKLNKENRPCFISYHYSNSIEREFPDQLIKLINEIT